MTRRNYIAAAASLLALTLSGCGYFDDEERLPGERIPVRATPEDEVISPELAAEIGALTPATANSDWPQVNGAPTHAPGHLAAPASLSVAWRADIGGGGEQLTATPVVAEGRVYTLDDKSTVSAFSTGGGALSWRVDLTPENEGSDDGFGGGLAYEKGLLFVTTGFGDVVALNASTGTEIWRQRMTAPVRAAPSVQNGIVIAISRDNTAFGFSADDGSVRWRVQGAGLRSAGNYGGASAAISPGGVAIVPFASGELVAVRATSGQRLWTDVASGSRRGLASSVISDISADPVILGVAVIAGNMSGQLIATDGRNGGRGWTREFGAMGPVWADGQTIWLVTDRAELKRLSGLQGSTMWTTALPRYEDEEDREDVITYGGPVLAGGRLLVTSSDGELLSFDPVTGEQLSSVEISGLSGIAPVVAGGVVYVITLSGDLVALR